MRPSLQTQDTLHYPTSRAGTNSGPSRPRAPLTAAAPAAYAVERPNQELAVQLLSAHPSRRAVLGGLAAAVLAPLARPAAAAPSHAEVAELLKPLLIADDPRLFDFAVTVFERCILGRIQPAEPPLRFPWLVPGGVYVGQWIWDTTFLTSLTAILPGRAEFIRGVYQNYWDFQERWNRNKPEYAHGMVANFMPPDSGPKGFSGKDWLKFPVYSQAPLLAWGVEQVYRRNRDLELVRAALPGLEAFHDWYWRERDVEGVGLVTVGSY